MKSHLRTDLAHIYKHTAQAAEHLELFKIFRWMLRACGKHFRLLYGAGIWLSRSEASVAIESGWAMLALGLGWELLGLLISWPSGVISGGIYDRYYTRLVTPF